MTPGPYRVRLASFRRYGAWHRVDGADDVVAVVRTPEDAIAIGALPDLAETLEALVRAAEHDRSVGMFIEDARAALKKMRGER